MDQGSRTLQRHSTPDYTCLVFRARPGHPDQGTLQAHQDLPLEVSDLEDNVPSGNYLHTLVIGAACAIDDIC